MMTLDILDLIRIWTTSIAPTSSRWIDSSLTAHTIFRRGSNERHLLRKALVENSLCSGCNPVFVEPAMRSVWVTVIRCGGRRSWCRSWALFQSYGSFKVFLALWATERQSASATSLSRAFPMLWPKLLKTSKMTARRCQHEVTRCSSQPRAFKIYKTWNDNAHFKTLFLLD